MNVLIHLQDFHSALQTIRAGMVEPALKMVLKTHRVIVHPVIPDQHAKQVSDHQFQRNVITISPLYFSYQCYIYIHVYLAYTILQEF